MYSLLYPPLPPLPSSLFPPGAEPQPQTMLVHLYIKKKCFDSINIYISLCGGVAMKFSLVKIPILRHWGQCFLIFSYGENFLFCQRGQGVNTPLVS